MTIFNEIDDTVALNIDISNIELTDGLICIKMIVEKMLNVIKSAKTSTRLIMITLRNVFVQLRDETIAKCRSSKET